MATEPIPNIGADLDSISRTWLRGLIQTALEQRLRPLCWHIEHGDNRAVATGYVTVSLLHEAPEIRRAWAAELDLDTIVDDHGYTGVSGTLSIRLPNAIDPDEHCQACNRPFDPRDTWPAGRGTEDGKVCRSCASALLTRTLNDGG